MNNVKIMNDIYADILKLRDDVNINRYNILKNQNKNDLIYGWAYKNNDVLFETLEDLTELYQVNYIIDILNVYKEILQSVQGGDDNE